MNVVEQRILQALGDAPGASSWESLLAIFRADREAFYLLACDGVSSEAPERLVALAGLARRVRDALRGSYQIESSDGGAHLVGPRVDRTFIPANLVEQVSAFLRAVDGKAIQDLPGKDYEGVAVSEAEVRFQLGDPVTWEAERRALREKLNAKPFVLRLASEDLIHLKTQPAYVTYELLYCARRTVLAPTVVYRGLKRSGDAPPKVNNGWAFFGQPRRAFRNDGSASDAPKDMAFVVFADEDGYVFDWDWIPVDPDKPGYPLGPLDERFEQEIKLSQDADLELPKDLSPGQFDPTKPCYSSRGDCIFCYLTEEESFGQRINADLTVFQSLGTSVHTGFKIKNIRRILQVNKSIRVSDPPGLLVSVDSVLLATLKRHPEVDVQVYSVLIQAMYQTIQKPPKVEVPAAELTPASCGEGRR
jgi:hypothetical protein